MEQKKPITKMDLVGIRHAVLPDTEDAKVRETISAKVDSVIECIRYGIADLAKADDNADKIRIIGDLEQDIRDLESTARNAVWDAAFDNYRLEKLDELIFNS